jgi:DSF synthase
MHIVSTLSTTPIPFGTYANLEVTHNHDQQAVWFSMATQPRPCFTWDLVRDILRFQETARANCVAQNVRYLVFGSSNKSAFSFGGDLDLFRNLIRNRDAEKLTAYANDCVSILYNNSVALNLPLTTISLVQGDALGGGFEAALSGNVVIAERSAKLGFPEIIFNLVPGHGAYNLLARRLDSKAAMQMILSGHLYSAEELHKMGVIDILVEDGEGPQAVAAYIRRQNKSWNSYQAMQRIKATYQPLTLKELQESADIWVEAALQVGPTHLRVMDRLIRAQNRAISERVPASMASPGVAPLLAECS